MQYAYDKGNPSSVQRTNNGKTQTYGFTYDLLWQYAYSQGRQQDSDHKRLHQQLWPIDPADLAGNGDPAQQERNVRNTLGAIKVMLQAIDAAFS